MKKITNIFLIITIIFSCKTQKQVTQEPNYRQPTTVEESVKPRERLSAAEKMAAAWKASGWISDIYGTREMIAKEVLFSLSERKEGNKTLILGQAEVNSPFKNQAILVAEQNARANVAASINTYVDLKTDLSQYAGGESSAAFEEITNYTKTAVEGAVKYAIPIGIIWKQCKSCVGGTSASSAKDGYTAMAYVTFDMAEMKRLLQASMEAAVAEKKLGELEDWKPNINNVINQLSEAHNTTKNQVLIDNDIDESELDNN